MFSLFRSRKLQCSEDLPSDSISHTVQAGTEHEPLLPRSEELETPSHWESPNHNALQADNSGSGTATTPLPWRQLLMICAMRTSEPVCICIILPFINEMILSVGRTNDPAKVGYYSGLVEGLFSLAQFMTVLKWGSISDRIGRRPMLLTGLFGLSVFTALFGLSRSFTMIIVLRFLAGTMNGNVAVMKSAIGELTDSTNQARAFSLLPVSWTLGSVISPLIAAFLSKPAERFPYTLGRLKLFKAFPYLLPCLFASSFCLAAFFVGLFYFEETLPVRPSILARRRQRFFGGLTNHIPWVGSEDADEQRRSQRRTNQAPSSSSSTTSSELSGRSTLLNETNSPIGTSSMSHSASSLIQDPYVFPMLVNYGFMAFMSLSIDMVLIQWLFTPLGSGGVGFSLTEIRTTLAWSGALSTIIMLVLFPPLQRRFGTLPIFRFGLICYPLTVLLFPVTEYLATVQEAPIIVIIDTPHNIWTWVGVGAIILVSRVGSLAFGANMLLVNASSPSAQSLGTVNGLAQMVGSLSRCIGPMLSTSLFAASISHNLLGGHLIWVFLFLMGVCCVIAGSYANDVQREGRR